MGTVKSEHVSISSPLGGEVPDKALAGPTGDDMQRRDYRRLVYEAMIGERPGRQLAVKKFVPGEAGD
jgi:hypothetical protein